MAAVGRDGRAGSLITNKSVGVDILVDRPLVKDIARKLSTLLKFFLVILTLLSSF